MLSIARTDSRSALVVAPAGMVMVVIATEKTPVRAVSCTTTSDNQGAESVADTWVCPPSAIVAGDADRRTVGAPSSSSSVSAAPVTVPIPTVFAAVPATVTARSTSSVRLSTAVTVTVSEELAVRPRGIVIVVSLPTVKAPDTAATVIVVGASEAPLRAADTVAVPPFSEMELGDADRVTVGVSSSSAVVMATSRDPSRA